MPLIVSIICLCILRFRLSLNKGSVCKYIILAVYTFYRSFFAVYYFSWESVYNSYRSSVFISLLVLIGFIALNYIFNSFLSLFGELSFFLLFYLSYILEDFYSKAFQEPGFDKYEVIEVMRWKFVVLIISSLYQKKNFNFDFIYKYTNSLPFTPCIVFLSTRITNLHKAIIYLSAYNCI